MTFYNYFYYMKKFLILILLLPLFVMGQAPTNDSTKLVVPPVVGSFTMSSLYYRGGNTSNGQVGYLNTITGKWAQLVTGYQFNHYTGASTQTQLNARELLANKQNSLATDGTGIKYPTVDAVNTGLALKLALSDTSAMLANVVHKALNETITGTKTFTKGAILKGQIGTQGIDRTDPQLLLYQPNIGGGHTLLEYLMRDSTEEMANTYNGFLSNGSTKQLAAQYVRFLNNDNTYGGNYQTLYGIHVVGGLVDNNPVTFYSNNSIGLLQGTTSLAPWLNIPADNTMQIGYSSFAANTSIYGSLNLNASTSFNLPTSGRHLSLFSRADGSNTYAVIQNFDYTANSARGLLVNADTLRVSANLKVSSDGVFLNKAENYQFRDAVGITNPTSTSYYGITTPTVLKVGSMSNGNSISTIGKILPGNLSVSQAVVTDANGALVSNAVTGTGNVVFSNSPTLVTPALGTPASGTITNLSGTCASCNVGGTASGETLSTVTGRGATTTTNLTTGSVTISTGTHAYNYINRFDDSHEALTVYQSPAIGSSKPSWRVGFDSQYGTAYNYSISTYNGTTVIPRLTIDINGNATFSANLSAAAGLSVIGGIVLYNGSGPGYVSLAADPLFTSGGQTVVFSKYAGATYNVAYRATTLAGYGITDGVSTSQLPIHGNSTTTGTATTAVTVTIGSTMANTSYNTTITPRDLLTAVNYYISAQTTTTFTVTFVTALTGSINFDWVVTP